MRTIQDFKLNSAGAAVALSNDGKLYIHVAPEGDGPPGGSWEPFAELPQEGFDVERTIAALTADARMVSVVGAARAILDDVKETMNAAGSNLASHFPGGFPGTAPASSQRLCNCGALGIFMSADGSQAFCLTHATPAEATAPETFKATDVDRGTEQGGSAMVACQRDILCNKGNLHPGDCACVTPTPATEDAP